LASEDIEEKWHLVWRSFAFVLLLTGDELVGDVLERIFNVSKSSGPNVHGR
jgi:hypothetical protein